MLICAGAERKITNEENVLGFLSFSPYAKITPSKSVKFCLTFYHIDLQLGLLVNEYSTLNGVEQLMSS